MGCGGLPALDGGVGGGMSSQTTADLARLSAALAWVDEVYPHRNRYGAAVVEMTWDQWNELRAAMGLRNQPVPKAKTSR